MRDGLILGLIFAAFLLAGILIGTVVALSTGRLDSNRKREPGRLN